MEIFFFWGLLSVIIGMIGSSRKIGFFGALLCSLLLSPIIGGIITLASTSKTQAEMLNEMKKQSTSQPPQNGPEKSIADELQKLKVLLDDGSITQEDYDAAKKKLLS